MRGGQRTAPSAYRPLLAAWPDPTGSGGELGRSGRGDPLPFAPSNFRLAMPHILCGLPQGPAGEPCLCLSSSARKSLCLRESEAETGVLGSPCTLATERGLAHRLLPGASGRPQRPAGPGGPARVGMVELEEERQSAPNLHPASLPRHVDSRNLHLRVS